MEGFHMRFLVLIRVLTAVIVTAAPAVADDVYVVVEQPAGAPSAPALLRMDASGMALATLAVLPFDYYVNDLIMAEDNRTILTVGYQGRSISQGAVWAVSSGGATSLWVSAGKTTAQPLAMLRDGDGDWRLFSRDDTLSRLQILRVRGGRLTTLAIASPIQPYSVAEDPETGLVVVRGDQLGYPNRNPGYYTIDPATGAITVFALPTRAGFNVYHGAHEPLFDRVRGGFLDVIYDDRVRGGELSHVDPVLGIRQLSSPAYMTYPYDMVGNGGRAWPAWVTVLARGFTFPVTYYLFTLGHDGKPLDVSVLPIQDKVATLSPMLRLGERHLTWFMDRPPNGRRLVLDFPGEGGRSYVAGFSVTGVRPGITLGDGRSVPIRVDGITHLGLLGGVRGVLEGTVGTLDRDGRATVKLDTNAFSSAWKGTVLWGAAIVLDPAASAGVAAIAGPTRVVLGE